MQRRPAQSRWVDVVWEPFGVVSGHQGEAAKLLVEHDGIAQWLHPGNQTWGVAAVGCVVLTTILMAGVADVVLSRGNRE